MCVFVYLQCILSVYSHRLIDAITMAAIAVATIQAVSAYLKTVAAVVVMFDCGRCRRHCRCHSYG